MFKVGDKVRVIRSKGAVLQHRFKIGSEVSVAENVMFDGPYYVRCYDGKMTQTLYVGDVELIKDDDCCSDNYDHYNKPILGKDGITTTVDVYRVLDAFNVTNSQLQHIVKKALCAGQRGHKDYLRDLQDIVDSAKNAIEMEKQKGE